ncbi:MAG: hypothetical protein U0Y68_26375 [Blastocatellia bacterium]
MSLSAATSTKGLSPQVAKDSLAYLRRAIERMKSLQATDQILGCLEQARLQRKPEKLKLKSLVTGINSLNLALREGVEAKVHATRERVQQELERAVAQLTRRDARAMTYDLRRFCEAEPTVLDLNALAALASFYYALPLSEASRSKYDFVITQLFSIIDKQRQHHLKVGRPQIAKRLTAMCQAWGEAEERAEQNAARLAACLQQFDEFIAEVKTIPTLEVLVTSAFFQRVRDFKTSLGPLFFAPEVTAASVEANVTLANSFLLLLVKECQELCETPEVLPLADAFSDTYTNEPEEITRILAELQSHPQYTEEAQAQVTRFTRLLQLTQEERLNPCLITAPETPKPDNLAELPSDLSPTDQALMTELAAAVAETEMDEALAAFAEQPENEAVIAAYRNASAAAHEVELACFLSPLPESGHEELRGEAPTRRRALDLILQADQFVRQELRSTKITVLEADARVDALFEALGECSDEMRDLIKISHTHEQEENYEVFLHVYNQLMAARLRLQSALVRRNTNEVVSDDPQEKEITFESAEETAPQTVQETSAEETPQAARWNAKYKWLVSVVAVLLVLALGVRFLTSTEEKATPKDDTDVVRVAQKDLPHGELFADIKLHRDLLLCVATEQWLTLGAAEQKGKLRELLQFAQSHSAKRVLLVDAKGLTVASATPEELYVN